MGLFDTVEDDFETDVEEYNPNLPAGTYEVIVSGVTVETRKDKNDESVEHDYLVITYTITEEESGHKGKSHREWQRIVPGRAITEDDKRSRQFIKTRMLSLGIPENQINTVEPEDIVGTEGALTLVPQRNNPDYNNVRKFALFQSGPSVDLPVDETPTATTRGKKAAKPSEDNPYE